MEDQKPLVSVVMPVHNDADYVGESITSVLNQDYPYFELLIVDDCSTDNSKEVIKSFKDQRIKLFSNNVSLGAAGARNIALRNAVGKYIAFLDADDFWEKSKLSEQIEFMEKNKIGFSCSRYTVVDASGKPCYDISSPARISPKSLGHCCYIGCLTAIYNQEVVGLIQVDERLKKRNDYAIWLQVIEKTGYCYSLDKSLACYRLNNSGISSNKFSLFKWHYRLFRWQFKKNPLVSAIKATINIMFYFYKRLKFKYPTKYHSN